MSTWLLESTRRPPPALVTMMRNRLSSLFLQVVVHLASAIPWGSAAFNLHGIVERFRDQWAERARLQRVLRGLCMLGTLTATVWAITSSERT